jgi:hypothetical protein
MTRRRILIVSSVLAAIVVSAWLIEGAMVGRPGAPQGAPGRTYSVAVVRDGSVVRRFSVTDLQALPQGRIVVDDKEQDGPTVRSVLTASGVDDFEQLTVKGAGLRDDGALSLPATRVDDTLLLDFSDRGTVKVCSPAIDWGDWVRDVSELRVD